MTKLQEIEQKLATVNDAVFQNVCDAVLFVLERNSENITRTGSQIGKQKTIKGTPDAYFTYPNGRYAFVEYTTKEKKDSATAFLKKIKSDLGKCLDEKETGINSNNIAKIIYCHNSKLLPAETAELIAFCQKSGVHLELKGIDQLALLLLGRAAYAAKLFLGINIDTAQILPVKTFVSEYEASGFATVLSNSFLGRSEELKQLNEIVTNNKITIVKGPPGTGKSRLVIACLTEYQIVNPNCEVFCMSNKNAPIFDDLRTYLNDEGDFLLFIDDANRQISNLKSLLPLLKEQRSGSIKVIITVRDYAFNEIYEACKDFAPAELDIQKATDEQITEIIQSPDFNIQNKQFVRRILEIAEGNPRLAIMAAKVANESQNLLRLHDASEIYDQYFQNAIPDHQLFDNQKLMKTLGVISFFYAIDLTNTDFVSKLLGVIELDNYSFNEAVEQLERLELIETSADYTIVKINDQVLSTFFFYKVFFKNQILDFGKILSHYFNDYTNRVKDSILPANNTFGYERVLEKITPSLNDFWNNCKVNHDIAIKFLQTFWFYRYEEVFAFLWDYIQTLPESGMDFEYNENQKEVITHTHDIYLDLLNNFFPYNLPQTDAALELSFEYVKKMPQHFTTFMKSIGEKFVFSYEDHFTKFKRQRKVFGLLYENFGEPIYNAAFYALGPKFLHMVYRVHTASRKKNTISWYHYTIPSSPTITKFRKKIWKQVLTNYRKSPVITEKFVDRYLTMSPDWINEIAKADLQYLLLLYKKFNPNNFIHCYLVQQNIWWFKRLEIDNESLNALKPIFKNDVYRQYRLINYDHLKDKTEYDFEDYEEYSRLKEAELKGWILKNLNEFKRFYKQLKFISEWAKAKRHSDFNQSVDVILEANTLSNPDLGWNIIKFIISDGNSADLHLWRLIKVTLEKSSSQRVKSFYKLLSQALFLRKTTWIVLYFDLLPVKYVNQTAIDLFIEYLNNNHEGYLTLYFNGFEKFLKVDPGCFLKILTVINHKVEIEKLKWSIDDRDIQKYFEYFKTDIQVVEKAYMLQDEAQDFFDFSCEALFLLIENDNGFLNRYIDFLVKDKYFISSREYSHLNSVWKYDNAEELLENAFVLIASKALISAENSFLTPSLKTCKTLLSPVLLLF